MSVAKVQRTKSVGAATVYAVYGTYENMRNGDVRAAAYSVVSATPDATPQQFISETVAEIARHPRRENQAELIIQSFHPDELDKDSAFDVELAQLAGQELARRIAPNSDVVVATHTDSDSGHLHNHIIIANHDRVTGKTPRNARNFHAVKRSNDEVMKDLGLEVYEPEPEHQEQQQNLRGVSLPEITKDNWRTEMTSRVDAVLSDPRVAAAPSVSDGLEVAQDIAAEYSVSFRVTTHKKQGRDDVTATSYALVNDGGDEIRYKTARGSRSTKRTGSRLGKDDYTLEAVEQRIQEQQQYQQVIQQQQIRQQENYDAQEAHTQEHDTADTAAVTAGGTSGIGGTESLRERYLEDTGTTDTSAGVAAPGAEEDPADILHGERTGRTLYDDGERRADGGPRKDGRDVSGRDRQHQAAVSSSRSPVPSIPAAPAAQHGAAEPQTARSSTPAPWSPDESVNDMRQVDFDFLEQRVMDDEFRQFQRSEFDGTDVEYFEYLLSDDDAVASEHENYAHARTRLFNPVGDQRERMKRSVGENQRRAAAARRQRQNRLQQQQPCQQGDRDGGD
ncbi:relaxase/mobilization nuclease domain-containing protein [Corynebacterium stationis]|uniref:relaxase/mobilization nuclease domain-containing protein n=1 Tax=Corynebacterium stationis TaxID=1705 RepID=UPI00273C9331|nr:relaxase/mobilization nuclease domain-containing protein [Corynebacterium stationis]WLP86164.1 relaxase/mobilization nuclease domain-containing protein [Corynebacterium stationis]